MAKGEDFPHARMHWWHDYRAPHHLAAEAGVAMLRQGGNALEAMIASAAAIAVVYSHMNAIGGDGFWLIAIPGRDPIGVQACGLVAALATPACYAQHGDSTIPARAWITLSWRLGAGACKWP